MNTYVPAANSLPIERLIFWEREYPDRPHLTQPLNGELLEWSWSEAMVEARRIANYLKSKDWPAGSRIALFSKNCAWWVIADYAIWMAGHITVPIFPTLSRESAQKILEHSEAKACFLGKLDNWPESYRAVPEGCEVIDFPYFSIESNVTHWEDVIAATLPLLGSPSREESDIATIIYTSGTTGVPKGVMHSFRTFSSVASCLDKHPNIGLRNDDKLFCYLALAHVAERALIEATAIHAGLHIFFNEELATFVTDLQRAQPSIFFAVPRLWTQFQLGVFAKTDPELLGRAFSDDPEAPALRTSILENLGLKNCRFAAGSGATMPPSLLQWYHDLGLEIVEGYGMTENFGCCVTNAPGDNKLGTVGRPWPGVELRISELGEIQMRAPWLMTGYFKDEIRTRETFSEDNWLLTGDKGAIDNDGRLRITGRIKEIFKTAKGKYVAPVPIENKLHMLGSIEAVCVSGADLPKPLALIILPEAEKVKFAQNVALLDKARHNFSQLLKAVNSSLDSHEQLACLVIVNEHWSQDSGHLTGTFKIRRDQIDASYQSKYEGWSGSGDEVIFYGF